MAAAVHRHINQELPKMLANRQKKKKLRMSQELNLGLIKRICGVSAPSTLVTEVHLKSTHATTTPHIFNLWLLVLISS